MDVVDQETAQTETYANVEPGATETEAEVKDEGE